jgi:hypothetical protein
MDDKTQKERLEQELKFLKESFEAEVISNEEFDKGKDRIEKKLREIRKLEQKSKEPKLEEQKRDEGTGEKPSPVIIREGETIKLKVIQDEAEPDHHENPEPVQIKSMEEKAPALEQKTDEKGDKFFKYAVVFVVLLLAVFFLYSIFNGRSLINEKAGPVKAAALQASKTNVLVVNDRQNCFNCDPQRVLGILESWFGELNVREISYNSDQGRKLAEKFDTGLLPLYILDGNISNKPEFGKFRQAFAKKNNSYILNDDAAGSTFYFKRGNTPNKLDLFIKADDAGIKAENNLREFLVAFGEVKFEKRLPSDSLTKELGIKSFPAFLINNRVKFSGISAPEDIKNNFCRLNKLPKCNVSLSKSLV